VDERVNKQILLGGGGGRYFIQSKVRKNILLNVHNFVCFTEFVF
jgi:hypothetical protein